MVVGYFCILVYCFIQWLVEFRIFFWLYQHLSQITFWGVEMASHFIHAHISSYITHTRTYTANTANLAHLPPRPNLFLHKQTQVWVDSDSLIFFQIPKSRYTLIHWCVPYSSQVTIYTHPYPPWISSLFRTTMMKVDEARSISGMGLHRMLLTSSCCLSTSYCVLLPATSWHAGSAI